MEDASILNFENGNVIVFIRFVPRVTAMQSVWL